MNSKTIFALLLSGIAVAANAQSTTTSPIGTTSVISGIQNSGSISNLPGGSVTAHPFGQAKPPTPPVVTPEPVTLLGFLPGLLFFTRKKKNR